MKIKLTSFLRFQYIVLILLFITSVNSGVAQSTSKNFPDKKQDESTVEDKTSLQGLTEAILIDGQPALRILSRKSGSTEIKFERIDGEDALIFSVNRLKSFGRGVRPADQGQLYVTKSRVKYVPYLDKENFFNALTSEIQDIELKKVGVGFEIVDFSFKNDKKRFIFNGTVFLNNSVFGIFFNKKDLRPSLEFLLKTLKDFDSAFAEFNQLTESVRSKSKDDEEEVEEEETEADVNDKYDRFKDVTIVSTSKMLVRGNKRSIRAYAEYSFAGKTQKKPEKVSLYFYASAARPLFREDSLELNFLVDDKRISFGEMKLADEEKTKTTTKQTVVFTMPYETFEQIANGKKVEFQIGTLEYKLTDVHLEAFRKLLTYKIEE